MTDARHDLSQDIKLALEETVCKYMDAAVPDFTNGDFDKYSVGQAFEDGAYWMLERMELVKKLHILLGLYCTERRDEQCG